MVQSFGLGVGQSESHLPGPHLYSRNPNSSLLGSCPEDSWKDMPRAVSTESQSTWWSVHLCKGGSCLVHPGPVLPEKPKQFGDRARQMNQLCNRLTDRSGCPCLHPPVKDLDLSGNHRLIQNHCYFHLPDILVYSALSPQLAQVGARSLGFLWVPHVGSRSPIP